MATVSPPTPRSIRLVTRPGISHPAVEGQPDATCTIGLPVRLTSCQLHTAHASVLDVADEAGIRVLDLINDAKVDHTLVRAAAASVARNRHAVFRLTTS